MHFVSAPVFGRPDAALEHRVLFAVAGPKEVKKQLQTYFDWMGRGTLVCCQWCIVHDQIFADQTAPGDALLACAADGADVDCCSIIAAS